jgi:hypothetical protein
MEQLNKNQSLDDAIRAMRETTPSPEQSQRATQRVFARLAEEPGPALPGRLRNENDFAALLPAYHRGELNEAQRLLVEDRLAADAAFRRQFDELRGKVRPLQPVQRPRSITRTVAPWAIAAALILTTGYLALDSLDRLFAPAGPRAEVASTSGDLFKVSAAGLEAVKPGAAVGEGEALRTAKGAAAVVRLPDGSLIEMNERAELSISAAWSGSTIRLDRGDIVVQAAKQPKGSLKVATRESTVSVKGTIFAVSAGLRGTQVAVVEGRVEVDQHGQTESLLPGQVTASQPALRATTVPAQVAWSKDAQRYNAMLAELGQIRREIAGLLLPSLRHESRLLRLLPAETAVFVAIPNLTRNVADAARIFEQRLAQSPALQQWWGSEKAAEARNIAEQLRAAGAEIGEEIVIAAALDAQGRLGQPIVLAEVRGASARASLARQLAPVLDAPAAARQIRLTDDLIVFGGDTALSGGFPQSALAATILPAYERGASWLFAANLEQILRGGVKTSERMETDRALTASGANQLRHLLVEYRELNGRPNTSAAITFSAPRTGLASWLAAPAPMPSLDYVSPDALAAFSAVTRDARQMAEDFFRNVGQPTTLEERLGINILDDLAGPLGGEVTLALDGPLVPVPSFLFAAEVYDSGRLTSTLGRFAQQGVTLTEQSEGGRTFYTLKLAQLARELHFTYDAGYVLGGTSRGLLRKALQTRSSTLSLPRSQRFRDLLASDAQVNASAILYAKLSAALQTAATLNPSLQQTLTTLASAEPVLITAYAGPDSIRVTSTTGFLGLGLDTLFAAGQGAPVLPRIMVGATPGIMNRQRIP